MDQGAKNVKNEVVEMDALKKGHDSINPRYVPLSENESTRPCNET